MPSPFDRDVMQRAVRAELDARPMASDAPSSAGTPPKRSKAPLYWSLAGMAAGQGYDGITSYQALQRPGTKEGNSLLYGADPSAARIAATKAGMVGSLAWMLDQLYEHKPKTAMAIAGALGGVGLAAGLHNRGMGK